MVYNIVRSKTHFEYSDVEADSREEALEIAQSLDDDEWEENGNAEITEQWFYEAEEAE